jgi:pimeloyl-ACP methyl ester carboxylesterase
MVGGPTFVLVHGAFHGGWCWAEVARRLRQRGAAVFAPTLTGSGERAHLLRPGLSLGTFVEDVASVIRCEELREVVLVGHSFSGTLLAPIAAAAGGAVASLIYLDAIIPEAGQSAMDTLPADIAEARLRDAAAGGGLSIPPPPSSAFGLVPGELHDWVSRRLTPQPLAPHCEKVAGDAGGLSLRSTYILCTDPVFHAVLPTYERIAGQGNCPLRELKACHDAMITAPEATADLLFELA